MHYRFNGMLTTRDCKRHLPHHFHVPPDIGLLEIRFHFAPYHVQGIDNLLTLTIFDPAGFRGAGHRGGDTHLVSISQNQATPGYLPGSLDAGEWTIQIDTHMVMPGDVVQYDLEINLIKPERLSHPAPPLSLAPARRRVLRPGSGWYRGDLHTHTDHSDADGRTVTDLLQSARAAGLDFIFLTDHNTISGLAEMDAANCPDLLTTGGLELTTFWGHALCLGGREWLDWRIHPGDGGMVRLAEDAYARNQIFIISHPQSQGDPGCTGCSWRFGEMMPGNARLIEIWNGPWCSEGYNEAALALWYDWLNQGLHLVATAGSDSHYGQDYAARPGFSIIYARELSEPALLEALLAGRLYMSAGPQLKFQAQAGEDQVWPVGSTLELANHQRASFTLAWADCPPRSQMRLIVNGRLYRQWTAECQGEAVWQMSAQDADWVVVELRGAQGEMLAITNPIYLREI